MGDHIGTSGNAMYRGIPATTVAWNNGTARSLTVFNTLDKSQDATVKSSKDNSGETVEMNRTDKTIKVKLQAKPVGANKAAALAISADLPGKMDILTITAASDSQLDTTGGTNTAVCDSASAKWSPEDELTVDIDVTIYVGKAFTAFS